MNELTKEMLEALKLAEDFLCGPTAWTTEQEDNLVEKVSCAIAKAEAAMAKPQPDADGWIKWEGGECPVSNMDVVDVIFKCGTTSAGYARGFDWLHVMDHGDIIAYRIAKVPQ